MGARRVHARVHADLDMAHYLHLIESTTLFGGSTITDLDLDNSGGSSKYRLVAYRRGEPQFKETFADSPLLDSKQLVSYRLGAVQEEIELTVEAASIDDLLLQINNLQTFLQIKARDAQVARNAGGAANYFYLADRPLNTSTKTYKCEILGGEVLLPEDFYDTNMLAYLAEPVILRFWRHPYVSASLLTILNAVSANNGESDYVDIGASGGTSVTGDLAAPLSVKVAGGDTATTRVMLALRTRGTPSNFKQIYWAKDATMTGGTAARNTDTTFDGNNTTNGSRTTAAGTSETKTHRWVNTTNVGDQFGRFHVWLRARSNTASRYSARVRVGQTDGTNYLYPASGGYGTSDAQAIGTDSGNALAWVYLGEVEMPALSSNGAAIYGIVYELYLTCSDTSGSPTLDVDGIWLMPVGEGASGSGFVQTTFDLATAASGVDNAVISALIDTPSAYLANASDVATFPRLPDAGIPLWALPARAARLFILLIDATNMRHTHTYALTVTVKHELRHSTVIGA